MDAPWKRKNTQARRDRRTEGAPHLASHHRHRRTARGGHVRSHIPGPNPHGLRPVDHTVLHGVLHGAFPTHQQEPAAVVSGSSFGFIARSQRGKFRQRHCRRVLRHSVHGPAARDHRLRRPVGGRIWIDRIMPPVVNGAIVAIIGFNLAPNVWTNFKAAPDTALVTLAAVLLIAVLFKGLIGRLNILLGVLVATPTHAFADRSISRPSNRPPGSASRSSTCLRPTSRSCRCSCLSCSCSSPRTSAM